jgi:segregation and condensation protein B
VPGRPALLATTRAFLDDLGLQSLQELPPLANEDAASEGVNEANGANKPNEPQELELPMTHAAESMESSSSWVSPIS